MLYLQERKNMCRIARSEFERFITNAAGGNFSMRVSDEHWIMTPTLSAQDKLNVLNPEDILVIDKDYNIIEGLGKVTREVNMHMAVYEEDPRINAVIHSHPKEMMVFATMGIDMPLITENVKKIGETMPCLDFAPATSQDLADVVRAHIKEVVKTDMPPLYGALLENHGSIVCGKSLNIVNDMIERLETNAYVLVQREILKSAGYKENITEGAEYNLEE